jgi:hypothetical protein
MKKSSQRGRVAVRFGAWGAVILLTSLVHGPTGAVTPPPVAGYAVAPSVPAPLMNAILKTRTALDPTIDVGLTSRVGSAPGVLGHTRLFGEVAGQAAGADLEVAIPVGPGGPAASLAAMSPDTAMNLASRVSAAYPEGIPASASVRVSFYDEAGEILPESLTVSAKALEGAQGVVTRSTGLPNGGMVYLTGGKIRFAGGSDALGTASLEQCGDEACLKFPGQAGPAGVDGLTVPIPVDALFAEVWDRVYVRHVDTFYLSIDPTPETLAQSLRKEMSKTHPHDRIRSDDPAYHNYRVVTAGDVQDAQIGTILYEADVLFKSAGVGFDVFKGTGNAVTGLKDVRVSLPPPSTFQAPDKVKKVCTSDSCWCRLYWSSNPQTVKVDAPRKRLQFIGASVTAHAEPMIVEKGDLKSYPQGNWCRSAELIAAKLTKLAATPESPQPAALSGLSRVARAQNFIKWVRDAWLPVPPAFESWVASHRSVDPHKVPEWTSGIYQASASSVSVNGGALLRALGIKDAARPSSPDPEQALTSPGGRPVFMRFGDTLHFWDARGIIARSDALPQQNHVFGDPTDYFSIARQEHLMVRGVAVERVHAEEGTLRFLLVRKKGTVPTAIYQGRFHQPIPFEWRRSIPLDPSAGADKGFAVWLDHPEGRPVSATDVMIATPAANFRTQLAGVSRNLNLTMRPAGKDQWLAELRTEGLDVLFDHQWSSIAAGRDIARAIDHVHDLLAFGFRRAARDRLDQAVEWVEERQNARRAVVDHTLAPDLRMALRPLEGAPGRARILDAAAKANDDMFDVLIQFGFGDGSRKLSSSDFDRIRGGLRALIGRFPARQAMLLHLDAALFESELQPRIPPAAAASLRADIEAHVQEAMKLRLLVEGSREAAL